MNRRLRVLAHWLRGRKNGTSALEVARFLFGPTCTRKAGRHIDSISDAGDHLLVRLRQADRPLYWPKEVDLYPLYMVLAETTDVQDWHFYEVDETRVTPQDVVVDCGAAEGIFGLLVHGRAKQVYLIEPSPMWHAPLHLSFRDAQNVVVLPYALAEAPGEARMSGGALDSRLVESGAGDKVAIETIDRLFHDRGIRISYLKADLEGHEVAMLAGAERTLRRDLPKIAITTYHHPEHARQIATYLKELDPRYRIRTKGIEAEAGAPVMLHAWVES